MKEHDLGYRIRQLLNQGVELDAGKLSRLKAAREQAIARQRVSEPRTVLVWAENVTGNPAGSSSLFSRFVLPTAMLVVGILAIYTWQQSQTVQELEEIDAAVLTSDLPIDAYLDRGFDSWLKRSSH